MRMISLQVISKWKMEKKVKDQILTANSTCWPTYRLNAKDAVLGVVSQRRHPAELSVEHVQDGGGVEHLLLKLLQERVVFLSETLGHGQSLLQLLLQGTLQRFLSRAVCAGNPRETRKSSNETGKLTSWKWAHYWIRKGKQESWTVFKMRFKSHFLCQSRILSVHSTINTTEEIQWCEGECKSKIVQL